MDRRASMGQRARRFSRRVTLGTVGMVLLAAPIAGCGSSGGGSSTSDTTTPSASHPRAGDGKLLPDDRPGELRRHGSTTATSPSSPGRAFITRASPRTGGRRRGTTGGHPPDEGDPRASSPPSFATQCLRRGAPIEKTFDWYAQDKDGNVWYMGEDSRELRHGTFVRVARFVAGRCQRGEAGDHHAREAGAG